MTKSGLDSEQISEYNRLDIMGITGNKEVSTDRQSNFGSALSLNDMLALAFSQETS